MAKYRKIDTRIWIDEKVCQLSDDGKFLFIYLLTHPNLTPLGAMKASSVTLADELNWTIERFGIPYGELFRYGMVTVSEKHKFVWVKNFLKYNKPDNPNVVMSWEKWLDLLPECGLKIQLIQHCYRVVCDLPPKYLEELGEPFKNGMGNRIGNGMGNQEQEQEQEQKQEQDKKTVDDSKKSSSLVSSSTTSSLPAKISNRSSEIQEVFEHWKLATKQPGAMLGAKRKRAVSARLKAGYSVESLKQAIEGCVKTPYNRGLNPQGTAYLDLELICRDEPHVDRFMKNFIDPPGVGGGKTLQQSQAESESFARLVAQTDFQDESHDQRRCE